MKRSLLLNLIATVGLCLPLFCCQPSAPLAPAVAPLQPGVSLSRIKTMIRSSSHFYHEYSYRYTATDQLDSYTLRVGKDANSPSQTTYFTYDPQGRLRSAERQLATSFRASRLNYAYDTQGRLAQITVYEDTNADGQFPLAQTIGYGYNADNQVSQTTVTAGNRVERTNYTYAAGNIIKTERTVSPDGGPAEIIFYQHDDKPNPAYGLPVITPSAELFNRNNIIYEGSKMTYTDGLLTGLQLNSAGSSDTQSFIGYTYETYHK